MCTKFEVHMFNIWTIIMQSLNIKEWKLLELQITQTRHHLSILNGNFFKFKISKNEHSWNVHKIGGAHQGAHLQCVKNHYARFEYKGMNTATEYIN